MIGLARCRQGTLPENQKNGFLYYLGSFQLLREIGNHVAPRAKSEFLDPASLPDEFAANQLAGVLTAPAIGPVDSFACLTRFNRRDGAIRSRARRDTGARAENRGYRAGDHS
jgi:hypothetical protein